MVTTTTRGTRELTTHARAASRWPVAVAVAIPALLWLAHTVLGRALNLFETGTAIAGGERILAGETPYTDFFAFYGPLTYLVPGLAHRVTGSVTTADFGQALLESVAVCVVAYAIAARLSGRRVAALLVPLALAMLGAATVRTLPALVSVLLLTRFEATGRRRWAVGAGAAGGVGLLWIQDAGAWICLAIALVWAASLAFPAARRLDWRAFCAYAGGVAAAIAPFVVWMLVRGALGAWLYWTFVFPNTGYTERSATAYVSGLVESALAASPPRALYVLAFWVLPFPAILLVAAGSVVTAVVHLRRAGIGRRAHVPLPLTTVVLTVYAALQLRVMLASVDEAKLASASAPAITAGLALALWALGRRRGLDADAGAGGETDAGSGAEVGGRSRTRWPGRAVALLAAGWLVLYPAWSQVRSLSHQVGGPVPQVVASVGGLPFQDAAPPASSPADVGALLAAVDAHAAPGAPILVLPTSPLLYPLTGRPNPTRYDYLDPVYTTPQVDAELAADVRSGRIALVVLTTATFPGTDLTAADLAPGTVAAVHERYEAVATVNGFTLLAPRTR
ncbi:hypothetical protein [Xylanimonas protaetiae]|uniref:Glycosyltransferase RgtA/B/C/D-like domain-containing protein n=1 Tax=Xylanimonas protaetiae TaxID=2509457 RepID=A0A4P6F1K4_9MICO|nr:hypothetical protein [Xylanimonas protaetiae]QAY69005.1 hypothetical protein ET471_02235 [Xylanimonas protaetiae]